ncbi:MAG: hypothetical protein HKN23_17180 [Verrucomicrobiales bacterium]|nr:hypothetical protein [Verrucomicrobiales bacterium]
MPRLIQLLIPEIDRRWIPLLLKSTALGSLIAGAYGVLHDQVTFTISPEYFTKFKFDQFAWAGSENEPARWFVAKIGFLATWWVGGIAGWALGRVAVSCGRKRPGNGPVLTKTVIWRFWIILAVAAVSGVVGFVGSKLSPPHAWRGWILDLGVSDVEAFGTVGQIHNFGYFGAVAGLIVAGLTLRRQLLRPA